MAILSVGKRDSHQQVTAGGPICRKKWPISVIIFDWHQSRVVGVGAV